MPFPDNNNTMGFAVIENTQFNISIIMPAYNVEAYIGAAIESVLAQTVAPVELIIINDGSTDATASVIQDYAVHPLIKIVSTENCGLGPARNLGLELAAGDFIYFFDADDLLDCRFVERLASVVCFQSSLDMIAFSGSVFCDDDSGFAFRPNYQRKIGGSYKSGIEFYRALRGARSLFPSACLYVTRRQVWVDSGVRFQPIVHEDEEVLFPLHLALGECTVIEDVLFHRRVRSDSIMTRAVSRKNVEGYEAALYTLLCLADDSPEAIRGCQDLWAERVRFLMGLALNTSLMIERGVPSRTVWMAYRKVFGVKSSVIIVAQYAKAAKRWLLN